MKKFRVPFTGTYTLTIEVEAEDKEEAIELAYDECYVNSYYGNGGTDKLIGVYGPNISIENDENYEELEDLIKELD